MEKSSAKKLLSSELFFDEDRNIIIGTELFHRTKSLNTAIMNDVLLNFNMKEWKSKIKSFINELNDIINTNTYRDFDLYYFCNFHEHSKIIRTLLIGVCVEMTIINHRIIAFEKWLGNNLCSNIKIYNTYELLMKDDDYGFLGREYNKIKFIFKDKETKKIYYSKVLSIKYNSNFQDIENELLYYFSKFNIEELELEDSVSYYSSLFEDFDYVIDVDFNINGIEKSLNSNNLDYILNKWIMDNLKGEDFIYL